MTEQQVIVKDPYEFYSLVSNSSFVPFRQMAEDPVNFVLSPYVREALFANFKGRQVKLAERYYFLINSCRSVEEFDLSESADFFARELLSLVFVTSGTSQAFLKALLTNYTITEQRKEERAFQEFREAEKEQKKLEWAFLPKRR